jgi:hypothetical protein
VGVVSPITANRASAAVPVPSPKILLFIAFPP